MSRNQLQLFPVISQLQKPVDVEVEDRESVVIDGDNDNVLVNDGGVNSGFVDVFHDFSSNGLVKSQEGSRDYDIIKKIFLTGMGTYANATEIVAIHRNVVSDSDSAPAMKARWLSFHIFRKAVSEKSGNNGNVHPAWYGGSRHEICQILSQGFNQSSGTSNGGQSHGAGVYLSPSKFPVDCVGSSIVDENGLSHMLLCCVILGRMEEVPAGSKQFQPSSTEFDSGVDNLEHPRRYIIWNAFMNSHIFPSHVISFKAPNCNVSGIKRDQARKLRPTSPWLSFPALMQILSRILEPSKMILICKYYNDFVVSVSLNHNTHTTSILVSCISTCSPCICYRGADLLPSIAQFAEKEDFQITTNPQSEADIW